MQKFGVKRNILTREELLKVEPALSAYADHIVGGTFTPSDESGDATSVYATARRHCANSAVRKCCSTTTSMRIDTAGGIATEVQVRDRSSTEARTLVADAYVVACGSYTKPLLKSVGVQVPIYPGKGYSATLPLLRPEMAPKVSMIDDSMKIADVTTGRPVPRRGHH